LDTELLKTFLEVQKTRHFGKAAENLYLTQSAVSFRIRQLEQNLGVALFSRHRNNIQLTEAGELLLPHAESVISALQAARTQLQQQISLPKRLTVAVEAGLQYLAAELLAELVVNLETAVHFQVLDSASAFSRQTDVVLSATQSPQSGYQSMLWRTVQLVAITARDTPAQAEGRLDWAGRLPQISKAPLAFSCSDPRLLRQWLGRCHGSAYLPQSMTQDLINNGLYRQLPLPAQQLHLWLWQKEGAPCQLAQSAQNTGKAASGVRG
jgi:DNA-binding transcriptional LysR family regulator